MVLLVRPRGTPVANRLRKKKKKRKIANRGFRLSDRGFEIHTATRDGDRN
jgi:hypothetical protein